MPAGAQSGGNLRQGPQTAGRPASGFSVRGGNHARADAAQGDAAIADAQVASQHRLDPQGGSCPFAAEAQGSFHGWGEQRDAPVRQLDAGGAVGGLPVEGAAGWHRCCHQWQVDLHPESPDRAPRQESDIRCLIGRVSEGAGAAPGPGRGDPGDHRGDSVSFGQGFGRELQRHPAPVQFEVLVPVPEPQPHERIEGRSGTVKVGPLHQRGRLRAARTSTAENNRIPQQPNRLTGVRWAWIGVFPVGDTAHPCRGFGKLLRLLLLQQIELAASSPRLAGKRGPPVGVAREEPAVPQGAQEDRAIVRSRRTELELGELVQGPHPALPFLRGNLPERLEIDGEAAVPALPVDAAEMGHDPLPRQGWSPVWRQVENLVAPQPAFAAADVDDEKPAAGVPQHRPEPETAAVCEFDERPACETLALAPAPVAEQLAADLRPHPGIVVAQQIPNPCWHGCLLQEVSLAPGMNSLTEATRLQPRGNGKRIGQESDGLSEPPGIAGRKPGSYRICPTAQCQSKPPAAQCGKPD